MGKESANLPKAKLNAPLTRRPEVDKVIRLQSCNQLEDQFGARLTVLEDCSAWL